MGRIIGGKRWWECRYSASVRGSQIKTPPPIVPVVAAFIIMKTSIQLGLSLGLAVLLAGCASSPQARIKKNPEAFNTYPAEVRTAIERGQVGVGFTPDQVRYALGDPDRVLTRTSESGNAEVWIYRERKSGLGLGLGLGFGGGSVGTGVGVSTGGREFSDERMRVIFTAGRVSAVEQTARP